MRSATGAVVTATVVAATLLAGCASGREAGAAKATASPTARSTASAAPSAADPAPLVALVRDGTGGRVTIRTRFLTEALSTTTGSWVSRPASYSISTTARDPSSGKSVSISTLVTERTAFLRAPGWDPSVRRCWLEFSREDLASATGLDIDPTQLDVPAPVDIARSVRIVGPRAGSVPLRAAAGVLTGRVKAALDPARAKGSVPVALAVRDDSLRIVLQGSDLMKALRAAGQSIGADGEKVLPMTSYVIDITPTDEPVRPIAAPAEDVRMTPEELQAGTC